MRRRLVKKMLIQWTAGILFLTFFGGLLSAMDLPSGMPDDLSDMSPYNPCLDKLCPAPPPRCPWYFRADALLLKRDRMDPVPIATLGPLPTNVAFSTDDLNSPFRAGPKFLLGHTLGDSRWQIDSTWFWVDSWNDTVAIRDATNNPIPPGGQGNLFSPISNFGQPAPIPGFDYNNYVSIREFSQFRSGELNLRYTLPMPHTCLTPKFIIGLRYIDIQERFDYVSQSNVPVPSSVSIDTRTNNDLFGPQLGGDLNFFVFPQAWINFEFKGAVCGNRALQDTTGTLLGRQSRDATSFVGDLDLMLFWQITPRLSTRIGYQAVWVQNLALASRNFDQPTDILEPHKIDTIGRAVYHGPHIGLEFMW